MKKLNLLIALMAISLLSIGQSDKIISKNATVNNEGVIYLNSRHTSYYGNLLGISVGENNLEMLKYLIEELNIDINNIEYNFESDKFDGLTALLLAVSKKGLFKIIRIANKSYIFSKTVFCFFILFQIE